MKRHQGGAIARHPIAPTGKTGGMATVWRTLEVHYEPGYDLTLATRPRQLRDEPMVLRSQPAHQSWINRRSRGRASCHARGPLMRLLASHGKFIPASRTSGHESVPTLTVGSQPSGRNTSKTKWMCCGANT
jgi:hypothetical protein